MNAIHRAIRRIFFIHAYYFCRLIPVRRDKVYACSFYGKGYSDNVKYIIESLIHINQNCCVIWQIDSKAQESSLPKRVIGCSNVFIQAFHLATSRVLIDNSRKKTIRKRRNQLYIQTWHGGASMKRIEADVEEILPKKYVKRAITDSKAIDFIIANTRFMRDLYFRSFWYNGYVSRLGYPRYEVMTKGDASIFDKVYNQFSIAKEKRIILYAPTFRKDSSIELYDIDFSRVIAATKKRFGTDCVVLLRLHPEISEKATTINFFSDSVIDVSEYPDVQELLVATEYLITDYSSIYLDFSFKNRPIFLYIPDLNELSKDRDLYFEIEEYPFPLARNNDELEKNIIDYDIQAYKSRLDLYLQSIGLYNPMDASYKIAKAIDDYFSTTIENDAFLKFHAEELGLISYNEWKNDTGTEDDLYLIKANNQENIY